MKNYYRIMLGRGSVHADEAHKGNFIGADYGIKKDLTHHLPDNWRDFHREFIPIYFENHPNKSKVAAGLACGMLWTIAKGIKEGDIVICPNGKGEYYVGEVIGGYGYHKGQVLPHRRSIKWYSSTISREEMSEPLRNSVGSIGTVSNITKHSEELRSLLSGSPPQVLIAKDKTIEDPSVFALEGHLEDFIIKNWKSTDLGKHYDIYEEDGEMVGRQYTSDTGPIDILAISKDKKEILVIELKRGRSSDTVVGQIQRYMGYVREELAEENQSVKGVIIAFSDDIKIRRALSVAPHIDFYTYKVRFKLEKK